MSNIPLPWSYVYRYPDGAIRMSGGREVNGSRPVEAIGVYLAPVIEAAEARVRELSELLAAGRPFIQDASARLPQGEVAKQCCDLLDRIDAALAADGAARAGL